MSIVNNYLKILPLVYLHHSAFDRFYAVKFFYNVRYDGSGKGVYGDDRRQYVFYVKKAG